MSLDLDLDDAQRAIADALTSFCRDRCDDAAVRRSADAFPQALWVELAELGILGLCTEDGEGGACELVAALESLGRAVFPGPLPATFLAAQLLDAEARAPIVAGAALVSVGSPPLLPWAPLARVFLESDGARVWRARPAAAIEPVGTLGGEPWGRVALEREAELGDAERAFALHDLALAAYAAAAARRLVDDTAEHARSRRQFGRAIGEFQAVAHPLADCAMAVDVAALLARSAAAAWDAGGPGVRAEAAAARLSASRAAVDVAHTCHQLFGAVGITLEGPAFHVSRRLLQLAAQPPDPRGAEARAAVLEAWEA